MIIILRMAQEQDNIINYTINTFYRYFQVHLFKT